MLLVEMMADLDEEVAELFLMEEEVRNLRHNCWRIQPSRNKVEKISRADRLCTHFESDLVMGELVKRLHVIKK